MTLECVVWGIACAVWIGAAIAGLVCVVPARTGGQRKPLRCRLGWHDWEIIDSARCFDLAIEAEGLDPRVVEFCPKYSELRSVHRKVCLRGGCGAIRDDIEVERERLRELQRHRTRDGRRILPTDPVRQARAREIAERQR